MASDDWTEVEDAAEGAALLADNLYDLLAPVRGILSDEEVDYYFSRTPSMSRPIDEGGSWKTPPQP